MPRDRSRSRERDRDRNGEGSSSRRRSRSRSPGRSERRQRDERDDENGSSKRRRKDDKERHSRARSDSEDEEERRRRRKREKERSSRKDRDSSEERERKAKKRARRARDDEAAIAAAEEQRRAAAEISVYSTVDNPFNDANLTDAFVWGKKRDKEKKAGMTAEEAKRKDAERRIEAKEELERLNRRRADREKEMEEREEEANRAARLAESAQMEAWHAKEDDFHLEQAMRRAQIRTREGRAKPIDLLALNLKWSKPHVPAENGEEEEEDEGVGLDVDLEEPYLIFDNLTLEETEELYEDITMYISLEKAEANLEFWRAMMVVCSSALEILRSERTMGRAAFMEQNRASEAVKSDITNLLKGKSLTELRQLQESVRAKLSSGDPIDVEYWEGLLKELAVWMAKAKLRTMHEVVLRNRLEHLRRKQRDEAVRVQSDLAREVQEDDEEAARILAAKGDEEEKPPQEIVREKWEDAMEPKLVTRIPMEDQHLQLIEPAEDLERLVSQAGLLLCLTSIADSCIPDCRSANRRPCSICTEEEQGCRSRGCGRGFGQGRRPR